MSVTLNITEPHRARLLKGVGVAVSGLGLVRVMTAVVLVAVAGLGVVRYPLPLWSLGAPLLVYAALLWWRPVAFLLIIPCVLPAWDLGLWTGWMMVEESDLFVAVSVAVLLVRSPPAAADLWPRGVAGWVLGVFVACWVIAAVTGLASPLGVPPSANVFMRPDNALRLGKGLFEALALLPFLRQRQRLHRDAVVWLGGGMALGIAAVTSVVVTERAVFFGVLDFTGDYRVSGPFTSMRFGGGYIGAYYGLTLPMALCLVRLRGRTVGMGLLLLTYLLGGYGLAVTFARTVYAAGAIGGVVAGAGLLCAFRRQGWSLVLGAAPVLVMLAILGMAAADTGMRQRFIDSARDFTTREGNWQAGLSLRDQDVLPGLFGMGLGTYQRAAEMRASIGRPSDIVVRGDGEGRFVSVRVEAPLYLGQKIILPVAGDLHLTGVARSADAGAVLGVSLCDKVLLYSDRCRGGSVPLFSSNKWQAVAVDLRTDGLGGGVGWIGRPVELSLIGGPSGHRLDIRDVRLLDDGGRDVLANGDFAHGLDRWILTDDDHLSWRMKNLYLMLLFQTGAFGLMAFLAMCGLAMAGGVRAAWRGVAPGAAVAGSIAAILVSGLFDDVVEPARLATLLFLVCLCGLTLWESPLPERSGL